MSMSSPLSQLNHSFVFHRPFPHYCNPYLRTDVNRTTTTPARGSKVTSTWTERGRFGTTSCGASTASFKTTTTMPRSLA
eukprot:2233130-Rhodomonas_salina.1